jgi:hypothetical protein
LPNPIDIRDVGIVLTLISGMVDIALQPGRFGYDSMLLGFLLLVGISPFGIHDPSEVPRIVVVVVAAVSVVLSAVTSLKGKLTLGLLSIFLHPVGLVAAVRPGWPGSVWAQLFYRDPQKLDVVAARFDPWRSRLERARQRLGDLLGGDHAAAGCDACAIQGSRR